MSGDPDYISPEETMRIWRRLTPAQRDYDRFVARRIPAGASWGAETEGGRASEAARDARTDGDDTFSGCSCHINPPCQFCTSKSEEGEAA